MIIGCPKEIKTHEYRVGLTPPNIKAYVMKGHTIYVESNAGEGIGFTDADYELAGAIVTDKKTLFEKSEMIIKVKEPIAEEYHYFRNNTILYTYLHLAADKTLTEMLLNKKICSIAYETISENRQLPCLAPMSAIAGRLSVQEGAKYIEKTYGGLGLLLGGVPGTPKANVVIIGGGVVGINAAQIAVGIGADVTILDISNERLSYIDQIFNMRIKTLQSNRGSIESILPIADVIIGAVLIPGAKAPKLISKNDLSLMKKGAILVDVAIDQGGCFETSKATTHSDPVYIVDGVVHYCVANMPGAVARTSTLALTNATLIYGLQIAGMGVEEACRTNSAILEGLNTYLGYCTFKGVAEALNIPYTKALTVL
ncbi:MAG: alanine dehydrogenase [Spirochaetota bacterium]|nr:alanine dehydrogenase [Spirochaetota bacterium]